MEDTTWKWMLMAGRRRHKQIICATFKTVRMKLKLLALLFGCTHGQRIIIMSVVEACTFEGMEDIVRESSVMKPLKTSNVTASYSKQLVTHALIQHTAYFYMLPMKICKHTHARARARAHTTRERKKTTTRKMHRNNRKSQVIEEANG